MSPILFEESFEHEAQEWRSRFSLRYEESEQWSHYRIDAPTNMVYPGERELSTFNFIIFTLMPKNRYRSIAAIDERKPLEAERFLRDLIDQKKASMLYYILSNERYYRAHAEYLFLPSAEPIGHYNITCDILKDHRQYLILLTSASGFVQDILYTVRETHTTTFRFLTVLTSCGGQIQFSEEYILNTSIEVFEQQLTTFYKASVAEMNQLVMDGTEYMSLPIIKPKAMKFEAYNLTCLVGIGFDAINMNQIFGRERVCAANNLLIPLITLENGLYIMNTIRIRAYNLVTGNEGVDLSAGHLNFDSPFLESITVEKYGDMFTIQYDLDTGERQAHEFKNKEEFYQFIEWFCTHVLGYLTYERAYGHFEHPEFRRQYDQAVGKPSTAHFISGYFNNWREQNKELWPMGIGPIPTCDDIQEVITLLSSQDDPRGRGRAPLLTMVYRRILELKCNFIDGVQHLEWLR